MAFTPAQNRAHKMLQLGYVIRKPMTGNNVCFLFHPSRRLKGGKIAVSTFTALLEAKLLSLKEREYPFETWVLT